VQWWECEGGEFVGVKAWERGVVAVEKKGVRVVRLEEEEEEEEERGGGEEEKEEIIRDDGGKGGSE